MKHKVSKKLKTKTASLGFTREDRESIAAEIADNLDVVEDATDEEINAAIDMAIDAVIPMLKVAQSIKNRAINESKKTAGQKETEDGDDTSTQAGSKTTPSPQDNDEPAYFTKFREAQEKRLADLEARESKSSRKSKLETALKNVQETFKSRTLKDFSRMKEMSEDEFEDYLDDVRGDAEAFIQEDVDRGLSGSHKPGGGAKTKTDAPTKEEAAEVAKMLNI